MNSYLLITGATGGLGTAFVMEAAKRGFDLFLTDRPQNGQEFANRLAEKFNIRVIYQPCDLADEKAREKFLKMLRDEGHHFWGLINVAGLDHEGGFLERSRSQILAILQINVMATLDITRGVLPLHDPDRRFRLINVCSLAGYQPMPFKATYAASKRFLLDFSRALREEIKPFGSVTALCPAGMPTTVECMRSIFAQGFWGMATSMDPTHVAKKTISAALRGKAVVIPGLLNQFVQFMSSLVPAEISARYVARRWSKARARLDDPLRSSEASLRSVDCT